MRGAYMVEFCLGSRALRGAHMVIFGARALRGAHMVTFCPYGDVFFRRFRDMCQLFKIVRQIPQN